MVKIIGGYCNVLKRYIWLKFKWSDFMESRITPFNWTKEYNSVQWNWLDFFKTQSLVITNNQPSNFTSYPIQSLHIESIITEWAIVLTSCAKNVRDIIRFLSTILFSSLFGPSPYRAIYSLDLFQMFFFLFFYFSLNLYSARGGRTRPTKDLKFFLLFSLCVWRGKRLKHGYESLRSEGGICQ